MWRHYRHSKGDNLEAQDLFPARIGDRSAISAGDGGAGDRRVQRRPISAGRRMSRAAYSEAYELAQRAVALDARYPNARFALGLVCMWTTPLRSRDGGVPVRRSGSIRALPPPMFCSGKCIFTAAGRRRRSSSRKREFGSAPQTRACSSGCRPSPALTTSLALRPSRSRSDGDPGRSIETGRRGCAMSSPGWPNSAASRRHKPHSTN